MKCIFNSTIFIKKLLGTQAFKKEEKYRPISFYISKKVDDGVLVFNTLIKEMIHLDNESFEKAFLNCDSTHKDFKYLLENWYIVPYNCVDIELNSQVNAISTQLDKSFADKRFVVVTTLNCNARCFYCFEHETKKYPMTVETAHQTSKYISKTSEGKKVIIQWFGGEPLCNTKVIDIICDDLRKENVNFSTWMITNGYLFDDNIINKAKNSWNLKSVQITLDGTEEIYNNVKNYVYKNNISPFQKVLNSIELLLNADISVKIRLNMDKHNAEDLFKLTDVLFNRFGANDKLNIYACLLFDECGSDKKIRGYSDQLELSKKLVELEKYIHEKGYSESFRLNNRIKGYRCMADNDQSIMILPNGNFSKCERDTAASNFGNVFDGIINHTETDKWKIKCKMFDECFTCPLLPGCVRIEKCPDEGYHECSIFDRQRRLNNITQSMSNEYEDFLSRSKGNTGDGSVC